MGLWTVQGTTDVRQLHQDLNDVRGTAFWQSLRTHSNQKLIVSIQHSADTANAGK